MYPHIGTASNQIAHDADDGGAVRGLAVFAGEKGRHFDHVQHDDDQFGGHHAVLLVLHRLTTFARAEVLIHDFLRDIGHHGQEFLQDTRDVRDGRFE